MFPRCEWPVGAGGIQLGVRGRRAGGRCACGRDASMGGESETVGGVGGRDEDPGEWVGWR